MSGGMIRLRTVGDETEKSGKLKVARGEVRELVESSSLENCRTFTGTVGSNPTLTASLIPSFLTRYSQALSES